MASGTLREGDGPHRRHHTMRRRPLPLSPAVAQEDERSRPGRSSLVVLLPDHSLRSRRAALLCLRALEQASSSKPTRLIKPRSRARSGVAQGHLRPALRRFESESACGESGEPKLGAGAGSSQRWAVSARLGTRLHPGERLRAALETAHAEHVGFHAELVEGALMYVSSAPIPTVSKSPAALSQSSSHPDMASQALALSKPCAWQTGFFPP